MPDNGGGYRKPPKSGQFKPGQSGNPYGRPKSNTLRADLLEELRERIELTGASGERLQLTKQRALLKMLMAEALRNEKSAIASLLSVMRFCGLDREDAVNDEHTLDADELELLKAYVTKAEAELAAPKSSGNGSPE